MPPRTIITFTHLWVKGFGWENTHFQPEDFSYIESFAVDHAGCTIFLAWDQFGGQHTLKGYSKITYDVAPDLPFD